VVYAGVWQLGKVMKRDWFYYLGGYKSSAAPAYEQKPVNGFLFATQGMSVPSHLEHLDPR
jgi:hypothetical protein